MYFGFVGVSVNLGGSVRVLDFSLGSVPDLIQTVQCSISDYHNKIVQMYSPLNTLLTEDILCLGASKGCTGCLH